MNFKYQHVTQMYAAFLFVPSQTHPLSAFLSHPTVEGGFVHKQVDATVCNKKCYPSLKLSMSTFLSFTPYPHSPSLTFNQLPSLSHSLYLHSAGSLTHSILTFPFSQFTFPITPSHTISLLTLPHPTFTLPRVTLHTYYFPKILFQFSVKLIIVKC